MIANGLNVQCGIYEIEKFNVALSTKICVAPSKVS